jgi:GDP-L-fucose synthase
LNPASKIYIAGHRGLVGSALVRHLKTRGYTNLVTRTHAELDLTKQAAVRDFFAREKPEYVFLAAAKVGGIHANNTYPAEFIHQNLAIQTNVIHESWSNNVQRLLFLGSSCVYPRDCPQPMKEEYFLTGPLETTNRPYAVAKIAGIEMCNAYNRQYGTHYIAVMPTNLYGPGDNYDLNNSHVLPALIRKFHLAKLASEGNRAGIEADEGRYGRIPEPLRTHLLASPLAPCTLHIANEVVIWGTGTPHREFLYSEDMADACVFIMNLPDREFAKLLGRASSPFEPSPPGFAPLVNIGCGKEIPIRELSELVKEIVGFTGHLTFDPSKPDGTMRKLLEVSKLKQMGWQSTTKLRDGVAAAYKSYLQVSA